jgi:hypothetical protein
LPLTGHGPSITDHQGQTETPIGTTR